MHLKNRLLTILCWSSFVLGQQLEIPDRIRIGAAVSLTGLYHVEGRAVREGYNVWAKWINDQGGLKLGKVRRKVELIFQDDESSVEKLTKIYNEQFLNGKVHFILGPYSSELNKHAQALAEQNKILLIQSGGAADSLFTPDHKYSFGVLTPATLYLKSTIELLASKPYSAKTVAIAYEDEPFSKNLARGAKEWSEKFGIKILAYTQYPKIKRNLKRGSPEEIAEDKKIEDVIRQFLILMPDIFIGCGHFEDSIRYIRVSKQAHFTPKAFVLTVGPTDPALIEMLGANANEIICPIQWDVQMNYNDPAHKGLNTPEEYAATYKKITGLPQNPGYQTAQSTAAGLAYQIAIERAGSLDTEKVRQHLSSLDIVTFFGPIKFDNTGKNAKKPMGVLQVQNNMPVLIGPKEVLKDTRYKLKYPKEKWII